MSEGLKQTVPLTLHRYQYYNLRDVTIKQLCDNQIIAKGNYSDILTRKPDGLILDGKNVLAVVEYKDNKYFNTEKKQLKAIEQSIEIAVCLKSKIIIATDGKLTIWVNALTKTLICDENEIPIKYPLNYRNIAGNKELEKLIDKINSSINKKILKLLLHRYWIHITLQNVYGKKYGLIQAKNLLNAYIMLLNFLFLNF
jgi:hypothetical protein